jgi:hypothetical protein
MGAVTQLLGAVTDVRCSVVFVRWRKASDDVADGVALIPPTVRPHQYEPRADGVLAGVKLDEAFLRPYLSLPLATLGGTNVKNIIRCYHNFLMLSFEF